MGALWDLICGRKREIKASKRLIDNSKENNKIDEYGGKQGVVEKIRIYLYGTNLESFYNNEKMKGLMVTKKIKDMNYLYIKNNILNAEYLVFQGEITKDKNEAIGSLLKDDHISKEFYDIIVVSVEYLQDESSKKFLNYFQSFTRQKIKQPFILYLTLKEKNPNIKCLYDLITNKYFDKRNLEAMEFPEDDFEKITNYISEKISYYNGYGDLYDKSELTVEYLFNILICGISGVGKSTFVNMFQKCKRSKEGEGNSVTDKIIRFTHPEYPIGIYDTPGFENETTVIKVRNLLENYNKILLDERKKINLILYFLPYSNRTVYEMEKVILDYLVTLDCEIIFIINRVTDDLKSDNYLKYMESFEDFIKLQYSKYPEFKFYMIPVNLYPAYNNGKIVSKAFGLDKLFSLIYEIFKDKVIEIKDIDKISSIQELFSFLNENKLYNQFKNKNDFILTLKSKCIKYVLKYSKSFFSKGNEENNIKNMIKEIYNLYYDDNGDEFYESIIAKKFSDIEFKNLYDDFFDNLDFLKSLNKINTFAFFKSLHDEQTIVIGNYCIKTLEDKFSKDPNLFIINNKPNLKIIKKCCSSINKAINSFKNLSNEFKNVYELLYKRDSHNKLLLKSDDDIQREMMNKNEIIIKENDINSKEGEIKEEKNGIKKDWWDLFF
jgi:GTP-binding protein EngB required for normal cell division